MRKTHYIIVCSSLVHGELNRTPCVSCGLGFFWSTFNKIPGIEQFKAGDGWE